MIRFIIKFKAPHHVANQSKVFSRFFYDATSRNDTIFAPSTAIEPMKGSALGVIRISGPKTQHVIGSLIGPPQTSSNPDVANYLQPRKARLTKFFEPTKAGPTIDAGKKLIDIGLLIWFPKPNSYTGEDVCELHLHGSRAIVRKMLDILGCFAGVRPAEPGEFTKRAVLNNKISLVQAESLPDLVAAQTDNQRKLALSGLCGKIISKYESWINTLINILAHLEASIDFGEDELIGEKAVVNNCIEKLELLDSEISKYVAMSSNCKDLIRSGFRVVILGKPNAGKSTFMNMLCKREKSIVSNIAGTTRDVIDHSIELCGHSLILSDTAGLREEDPSSNKEDAIEREGIRRAIEAARKANLIFYMVDAGSIAETSHSVQGIINELQEMIANINYSGDPGGPLQIHLVINKIDLNNDVDYNRIIEQVRQAAEKSFGESDLSISHISCKTQRNIDKLINQVASNLNRCISDSLSGKQLDSENLKYVNERHVSLLLSAHRHLSRAVCLDIQKIDEMAQHVRESVDCLSRIVGTVGNEQVFDVIFKDFCIGK